LPSLKKAGLPKTTKKKNKKNCLEIVNRENRHKRGKKHSLINVAGIGMRKIQEGMQINKATGSKPSKRTKLG